MLLPGVCAQFHLLWLSWYGMTQLCVWALTVFQLQPWGNNDTTSTVNAKEVIHFV